MRKKLTGRQRAWMAAACMALGQPLLAADGIWINDTSDSDWSLTGNWAGGIVADGVDAIADFTVDLASPRIVNLDAPHTVGTLLFEVAGFNTWTLSGASTLTLATTSGAPLIDVAPGTIAGASISSQLAGTSGFEKTGVGILNLHSANLLSGVITVSGGRINAGDAGAFGSSSLVIGNGVVSLNDSAAAFTTPITIGNSSSLQANPVSGTVTLTPAVNLTGTALVSAFNGKTLVLSGGTSGAGQLEIRSSQVTQTTTIDGSVAHTGGLLMVTGTTNLNAANTYTGDTTIQGGTVNLGHASALPSTTALSMSGGTLNVNNSNTVASLAISGGSVLGAGTLTAAGNLPVHTAFSGVPVTINTTLAGISSITKTGFHADATFTNIGSTLDASIDIQQGRVRVQGVNGLGSGAGGVSVSGASNALLDINIAGAIGDNIALGSASGFAYAGALTTSALATLNGDISLGAGGSYFGGGINATFSGAISGGALTKVGSANHLLTSGSHTYTGATTIGLNNSGGSITVGGANGALSTTSSVTINRGGTLALSNITADLGNRLGDSIPITLNGGVFNFTGRAADVTNAETVGAVTLNQAHAVIQSNRGSTSNRAYLTLGSLARQPGATVNFFAQSGPLAGTGVADPRILITGFSPANLDDGIVGGWAIVGGGDFATYELSGPRGVQDLADTGRIKQLDDGVASDNIILSAAQGALTADRSVNSTRIDSGVSSVNFGGFALNVESGGILLPGTATTSIANGTLTAGGSSANRELFIIANGGTRTFNTDITDNPGGAVSLVVSPGASSGPIVALGGTNTYSGATYVNASNAAFATLRLDTLSAIPVDGDLEVNGGSWSLQAGAASPGVAVDLGAVALRQNGTILGSASAAAIDADSYAVESGTISLRMQGAGPMTKSTAGTVTIVNDNSTASVDYLGYTGNITLNGGILTVGNNSNNNHSAGDGTITVNSGARLVHNRGVIANAMVLAGGELASASGNRVFAGDVNVAANSRILTVDGLATTPGTGRDVALTGIVTGSSDLELVGNSRSVIFNNVQNSFTGNIAIPAGVELRLNASEGAQDLVTNTVTYPGVLSGDGKVFSYARETLASGDVITAMPERVAFAGANTFTGTFFSLGFFIARGNVPAYGAGPGPLGNSSNVLVENDLASTLAGMVPDAASTMEWSRNATSFSGADQTRIGSAYNPAGGANQTIVWKAKYAWDGGGGFTLYRDAPAGPFNPHASVWNGVYVEDGTTFEIYGGTQTPTGAFNAGYDGAKPDNMIAGDNTDFSDVHIAGGGSMRFGPNFDALAYADLPNGIDLRGGGVYDNTVLESQTTGRHFQSLTIGGGTYRVSNANQTFAGSISIKPGIFDSAITTAAIETAGADLALTGTLSIAPGVTLQKTGAGALSIDGVAVGGAGSTLSISAGSVNVNGTASVTRVLSAGNLHVAGTLTTPATGGDDAGASKIANLTTSGAGQLDITDNKLIITGQSIATVTSAVAAGRNGGAWDGSGIVSSLAAAQNKLTTLAVATAGDLSKSSFGPHTVDPTDVLVMYTYTGDADFNGEIDGDDYAQIDAGYSGQLAGYFNGDFDYSGGIDADDYFLIDRNYARQGAALPAAPPAAGVAAVPEPASIVPALLSTALLRRRRRQR